MSGREMRVLFALILVVSFGWNTKLLANDFQLGECFGRLEVGPLLKIIQVNENFIKIKIR